MTTNIMNNYRILFIGLNADYINPTNYLISKMINLLSDVTFYGPGFSSDETLKNGLKYFLNKHEKFDFILLHSQLIRPYRYETERFNRKYCTNSWGPISVKHFINDVYKNMTDTSITKIVFGMDLDHHGVSHDTLNHLDIFSDYIVAWGIGFSKPNNELKYLDIEPDYQRKMKLTPIGLWHDYSNKNKKKIINLGHFIDLSEFNFNNVFMRKYDVSVPGILYYRRNMILDLLKKQKNLKIGKTNYLFIYSILDKIGFSPYANVLLQTVFRVLFKNLLNNSKISITDGGAYEMTIRKFFEIPASGSLLLAYPCASFEALGFVNNESAIIIEDDDPIGQITDLLDNSKLIEFIAHNGRNLVWEKHSITARSSQLNLALKHIKEKTYNGSFWKNGNFKILN